MKNPRFIDSFWESIANWQENSYTPDYGTSGVYQVRINSKSKSMAI